MPSLKAKNKTGANSSNKKQNKKVASKAQPKNPSEQDEKIAKEDNVEVVHRESYSESTEPSGSRRCSENESQNELPKSSLPETKESLKKKLAQKTNTTKKKAWLK